ncbi:MFS transporter [Actinomadura fibrosa]|uniref:MFS transporter n=1 Tax=Actinomadura fibrosa TaxID=111802 RepID=A0ABW2XVR9_9ACTN|nr:MFS transporter [Actinomadura fibrosa]
MAGTAHDVPLSAPARSASDPVSIPLAGTIAFCVLLATLGTMLPLGMLDQIGPALHASGALLNWAVIAGTVVGAVASGIFPPLASSYGQRTMLAAAMAALTIGAVLAAVAPNMPALLAGRFLGAFSMGAIALSLAIARTHYRGRTLSLVLGWIAAAEGAAAGLGFVFGGLLAETLHVGWRTVFWILAALGAAAGAAALATVPRGADRVVRRVDWVGGLLLGLALVLVLVPLSQGPNWGWRSASVLAPLAAGLVTLAVWWRVEDRTAEPMINTRALRDRTFLAGWIIFLLSAMLVWIIDFSIPAFATAPAATGFGLGYSALKAGMIMVPMCAGITVAGAAGGALNKVVSSRALALAAFACAALCMALLAVAHGAEWQLWVWPAVFGACYGTGVAAAYMTFIKALPPEHSATSAGIGQVAGTVGASTAGAGVTAVLTADVVQVGAGSVPTESSFELGWWIGAGIAVLGGLLVLAIRPRTPA